MPGLLELLIVVALIVLLFGARRLPELGHAAGKMLRNYRQGRASREDIEVKPTPPEPRLTDRDAETDANAPHDAGGEP